MDKYYLYKVELDGYSRNTHFTNTFKIVSKNMPKAIDTAIEYMKCVHEVNKTNIISINQIDLDILVAEE
jgi:hypothetical protein